MRTPMYEKKDSANKKSTEQRNESSLHNLNFDSGNVKTLTRAEIKEKIQKIKKLTAIKNLLVKNRIQKKIRIQKTEIQKITQKLPKKNSKNLNLFRLNSA